MNKKFKDVKDLCFFKAYHVDEKDKNYEERKFYIVVKSKNKKYAVTVTKSDYFKAPYTLMYSKENVKTYINEGYWIISE